MAAVWTSGPKAGTGKTGYAVLELACWNIFFGQGCLYLALGWLGQGLTAQSVEAREGRIGEGLFWLSTMAEALLG